MPQFTEATDPVVDQTMPTQSVATPLQTQGLSKSFRQGNRLVTALQDVTVSVAAGEFVAIMGASGSGKSTLLHLAAGLTKPDGGRVSIDGVDLSTLRDPGLTRFRRDRIGLVFQSFNLIPTLTVRDNVLLPVLSGGRQGTATADELLDRLGLQDRRDHRPDSLSGGEQQRVAIARALISDPAILLADEPTGSLDSVTGQSICRQFKNLQVDLGRTVVVVTHEPAVAVWADRVIVLKDGRLLTEFSTSRIDGPQRLALHYHEVISDEGRSARSQLPENATEVSLEAIAESDETVHSSQ